jgi:hypothetical protein
MVEHLIWIERITACGSPSSTIDVTSSRVRRITIKRSKKQDVVKKKDAYLSS